MYLKSLELQGFKSFPDKTTLYFDNGATVIVGPNGSGKSNITDAMRWVLGELSSKSIRGTKMEDVIFIGTEVRKPMSFAEVSVTFDNSSEEGKLNSPYDTITVTRRYFRAGESEYLINKKSVRLRDIYELFMNTGVGREGYSIIGQGRIAEIISKKSEDRRNIFEEAAGISKYRYKKEEAEKKLTQTQENMDRAYDIFHELESRVGPLEKEAEKAKKYNELYGRKKEADVSLWIFDSQKAKNDIEKLNNDYKMSSHELEMAQDSIDQIETQDAALYEKLQDTRKESEKVYAEIKSCNNTISELNSDLRVMENNVEHAKISSGSQIEEMEKLNIKKQLCISDIEQKEQNCDAINKSLDDINSQYNLLCDKKKEADNLRDSLINELDELLKKQVALEKEKDEINIKITVLENSKTSGKEKKEAIINDIEKYKSALSQMLDKGEKSTETLSKYEESLNNLEDKINVSNAEIDKNTEKYNELKEEMDKLISTSSALEERIRALKNMEELFEGYTKSVGSIMNAYIAKEIDNAGTVYGPVSTLIKVEDKYITAVETALGAGLQHIVVDNENTAKACISFLKQTNSGRATFYPISSVSGQAPTQEMKNSAKYKGYIGVADSLISFNPEFEKIFSSLLGRTVIFDNLNNATVMAKEQDYRIRVVTLDGQQINVGGSFSGGSVKHEGNILSRSSEIKRMEEDLTIKKSSLEKIKKEGQALGELLRRLMSEKNSDKQQFDLTDTLYRAEKTDYDSLCAQIKINKDLLQGLTSDSNKIVDEDKKSSDEISRLLLSKKEIESDIESISEKRLDLDVEKYEATEKADEIVSEMNKNLIRTAEIKKDLEAGLLLLTDSKNRLSEVEDSILECKNKMKSFEDQVASSAQLTKENRDMFDEANKRLENLENQRNSLSQLEQELEKKRNYLNTKNKDIMAKKETVLRAHTMNETKLEQLHLDFDKMVSKLYEDYGLTYSSALELGYPEVNEKNRKEVASVLAECKQKLKNLGSVNPNAIEEFKEVKERYDYLNEQITDLNKSKEDLSKIITDLETEMKKNFVDAFDRINENFNEVFKELFGGGHAELSLTDEEDVLNCGIDIKAAPPGKVIKSLMLLSGGEQSFVAIALLFAILKVNPTPFCIFDEIEAALDEVNVSRFGQYIKKYSNQTQFIVITHRRGTMEIADRLYGVTMPQKGISKVLTMNVKDVGNEKILNVNNKVDA